MENFIKIRMVWLAAIVIFLQGCAGQVNLTKQDRDNLKNLGSVPVMLPALGWPALHTPAGVLASQLTVGLSEDWTEGQKLVHKFEIKKPSETVKELFIKQINTSSKVANFVDTKELMTDEGMANLKTKYKNGVALQISSPMWQIWYYPFSWGDYQMWYGAKAELVSIEDGKILWSATCRADQKGESNPPSLDKLTRNGSTVLQKWVEKSTSKCAKELAEKFNQG